MTKPVSAEAIDAILPQTQCGLCTYKGCMPYAKAIAEDNVSIDLCPPGGVDGLKEIATLTGQDPSPFIPSMQERTKPILRAVIREDECIGCTKCIQACPVDAIMGASKSMHTVITDECTGCELCVAPCPVDCIDMVKIAEKYSHEEKTQRAKMARSRYYAREERLKSRGDRKFQSVASENKAALLQAALLRTKLKKTNS